MSNPVDPIEAVGGVSSSKKTTPTPHPILGAKKKDSDLLFSSNYVLIVMEMTNKVMQNQTQSVAEQGNLQEVITKIQQDINTINQYISTIQSHATAGGSTAIAHGDGNGNHDASPNSSSGLDRQFYHMNDYTDGDDGWHVGANFGGDSGVDGYANNSSYVSQAYQDQTKSFITAVKELFFSAAPVGSDITVGDLSKITTQYGDFDLNKACGSDSLSFWQRIGNPIAAKGYDRNGYSVISTDATKKPSLLQQYAYYSAKAAAKDATKEDIKNCNGNIWNLKGLNFNSDDGCDGTMRSLLSVLDNMNVGVSITRSWSADSSSLLDLIIKDSPDFYNHLSDGSTTWGSAWNTSNNGKVLPGVYEYFSELAYNYFWTKNPSASDDVGSGHTNVCLDHDHGVADYSHSGWDNGGHIAQGSDSLSAIYLSANSAQTGMTSTGTTMGQTLNQKVADTQSMNDSVKQIINNFTQGQGSTVNNFKS